MNNENANGGNGGNNGCSYKTFMACNPKEYDGKGGAIALTRWIKKMESVFDNSGCAENQRVKFVASSFVNKALTWWNTQVQARGRQAAIAKLVPHLVTPKLSRIKRAGILTDEAVSCGTLTKGNEKRKGDFWMKALKLQFSSVSIEALGFESMFNIPSSTINLLKVGSSRGLVKISAS
ncbi:hypothetical protein Tco_0536738 [Tanacetum coccineum]